ncbi:MAG: hypothetical protein ACYSWW_15575 [Planctomycetota bacterium]|jgi:hypothetical protein
MPIYLWTKQGALLITKAARYVLPAVIATGAFFGGYIVGIVKRKKTKAKDTEQPDRD